MSQPKNKRKQQPKTRKNKKKQSNNRPRNQPSQRREVFYLSPCATSYAKAKLDPFSFSSQELPCIPDLLDLPSYKLCSIVRGTLTVGTGGLGFVMAAGDWNANNSYAAWASSSAFTGVITPSTIGTGVIGFYDSRFPFDGGIYCRNHRMVASALRIRYTGTELQRGGQIVMYVNNTEANSLNSVGIATYSNVPEATRFPVERKWSTIAWNPGYKAAYDFDIADLSLTTTSAPNAKLQAIVTGEVGNTFEWEIIGYHELISYGVYSVPSATKSHTDIPGMSLLRDFISSETVTKVGATAFQSFLTFAKSQAATAAMSHFGVGGSASRLRLQL